MLACSVLLLTACGPVGDGDDSGTSGSSGAVRDGGTMTVALADDPDMLDSTLARTLVGRMVFMSMCEKLYDIDQKLNVVPQLAASPPTISQDGRSAEIKLRQGSGSTTTRRWTPRRSRSPLDRHVPSRLAAGRQRQRRRKLKIQSRLGVSTCPRTFVSGTSTATSPPAVSRTCVRKQRRTTTGGRSFFNLLRAGQLLGAWVSTDLLLHSRS